MSEIQSGIGILEIFHIPHGSRRMITGTHADFFLFHVKFLNLYFSHFRPKSRVQQMRMKKNAKQKKQLRVQSTECI